MAWLASACCGFGGCPPQSAFPDAQSALDSARAAQMCSRGLRGEAKLDYIDDKGRVRVKAFFLAQHPQNLRLDILSPLGGSLATFTADDKLFALLDQEQGAFHVGPAHQCNVERFLRVPVPPDVLVQLMAGEAPVLVHEPEQASISWDSGRYVIEIQSKHGASQTIELEPRASDWDKPYSQQRLRVVGVSVRQQGVELYRAELSDHSAARTAAPREDPLGIEEPIPPSGPQCRAEVPGTLRFVVPLSERDVVFEYEQVEHNPPLTPGVFRQSPPGGVKLMRALCE